MNSIKDNKPDQELRRNLRLRQVERTKPLNRKTLYIKKLMSYLLAKCAAIGNKKLALKAREKQNYCVDTWRNINVIRQIMRKDFLSAL